MKIDFHYGMDPSFGPLDHEMVGIGGTENCMTYASEYMARAGHDVRVYNKITQVEYSDAGVPWHPLSRFNPTEPRDVLVSHRVRDVFKEKPQASLKVLILADTESHGLGDAIRAGELDLAMFVGRWQADKICAEEGIEPGNAMVTANGVAMELFDALRDGTVRVPGKCIYLGTPERGLEPLLDIWPAIQKRAPHASLDLYSSFIGWKVTPDENEAMCHDVYARIDALRAREMNVFNHRHASAQEIRRALLSSQLYLYPTRHFNETCCISALEASAAGVPIIATARAALKERVKEGLSGYLIQEGENHDEFFVEYAAQLLYDRDDRDYMSLFSVELARRYDYKRLTMEWANRWADEIAVRA